MSCTTPSGQTDEQYTLPNSSVTASHMATAVAAPAMASGKICMRATQFSAIATLADTTVKRSVAKTSMTTHTATRMSFIACPEEMACLCLGVSFTSVIGKFLSQK